MMEDAFGWILKNMTPGGAGIWVLVVMGFLGFWKVLPSFIEAIANRQSKIEERLGHEMDAMSERWERRLEDADKHHRECMAGQETLRQRIVGQDQIIATQNETIAAQTRQIVDLTDKVSALKTTNEMLQIREAQKELDGGSDSAIYRALDQLRKPQ